MEIDPNDERANEQFGRAERFLAKLKKLRSLEKPVAFQELSQLRVDAFEIMWKHLEEFEKLNIATDPVEGLQQRCLLARELYIYGEFFLTSSKSIEKLAPLVLRIIDVLAPANKLELEDAGDLRKFQSNIMKRHDALVGDLRRKGYSGPIKTPPSATTLSQVLDELAVGRRKIFQERGNILKKDESWRDYISKSETTERSNH